MASWQAHVTNIILRRRMRRRMARIDDVATARAIMDQNPVLKPRGLRIEAGKIGGVPVEQLTLPSLAPDAPVLLYLHGGGYFGCSPATHRPITAAFARARFRVVAVDYRLAPEHTFPAAIEDAVAVHRALLNEGTEPWRVTVAGDSAGGGLALAMLLLLRDALVPLPAAAGLFSPWTDLAATGASVQENDRKDVMFGARELPMVAANYLAGADPRDPLASPLYADLSGLPLLHIHVGRDEVLRDDSTRLAEKARAAGTPAELKIWPVVPHAFPVFSYLPEARASIRQTVTALRGAVAPPPRDRARADSGSSLPVGVGR